MSWVLQACACWLWVGQRCAAMMRGWWLPRLAHRTGDRSPPSRSPPAQQADWRQQGGRRRGRHRGGRQRRQGRRRRRRRGSSSGSSCGRSQGRRRPGQGRRRRRGGAGGAGRWSGRRLWAAGGPSRRGGRHHHLLALPGRLAAAAQGPRGAAGAQGLGAAAGAGAPRGQVRARGYRWLGLGAGMLCCSPSAATANELWRSAACRAWPASSHLHLPCPPLPWRRRCKRGAWRVRAALDAYWPDDADEPAKSLGGLQVCPGTDFKVGGQRVGGCRGE